MFLGTLGASFLGNLLTGKGTIKKQKLGKTELNLMVFIKEITCLKQKMGHL